MAKFNKGDRVKIKGGSKLGTIVGFGTYKSADGRLDYQNDYEVRWDGYPFNVPVKEQNLVAANSCLNAKREVSSEEKRMLHELTVIYDKFCEADDKEENSTESKKYKKMYYDLVRKLESHGGKVKFGGVGKDLILVYNSNCASKNSVVRNAVAWKAKNAADDPQWIKDAQDAIYTIRSGGFPRHAIEKFYSSYGKYTMNGLHRTGEVQKIAEELNKLKYEVETSESAKDKAIKLLFKVQNIKS